MSDEVDSDTSSQVVASEHHSVVRTLAAIAVLSIAAGLLIQLVIVGIRIAYGSSTSGPVFVVSLANGVTWSLLVCTGVGIGTVVIRMRAGLSGLLSFVAAPIAVAVAKASQRMVAGLLEVAEQQAVLSLGAVSLARAVEYGVLGFLLGTLAQRGEKRIGRYLGAGALVGLVLGGIVVAFIIHVASIRGTPLAPPAIAASVINEMVFPICCALVIYAAQLAGQNLGRGEMVLNRIKV